MLNTGIGNPKGPDTRVVLSASTAPARYFIEFRESSVAQYDGNIPQIGSIPRLSRARRRRLDVQSTQARQYEELLSTQQAQHLTAVSTALGRTLKPLRTLRHALNAVVVEISPQEARMAATVDGVARVRAVGQQVLATDLGPQFIGATALWQLPQGVSDDVFAANFDGNTPKAQSSAAMGDGVVVGDIDTGYNSLSPSFAQTDDTGYTISNPLGAGVYLGQCGTPNIALGACNNKVIGVYDELNTGSVEDNVEHGSHTASTAAGNSRSATLNGYTTHVSGVAPHANLVIFHACAPAPTNCPEDALTQAVDDAISGGAVDVINYSISGGTDPWNDTTSQAFLSAQAAGIFVAAAAGNTSASTPAADAGTANHFEPWVTTVAAANHTGGSIAPSLSLTGPGSAPANTQDIGLAEAQGDTAMSASIVGTTPIVLSPQFHIADTNGTDGCSAYASGAFQNAIALISRGTCTIATKVANANAAGAVAVLVADNRPEAPVPFSLSPVQPIPVFTVTQADATNLATFLQTNANRGTASIPNTPLRQRAQADQLASFSLLGPAPFDTIKPDVQAPGVSILAAINNDGTANGPNAVGLLDGTSMATPHTTGAAALLVGEHADWTPMEIQSALMMTAKEAGLTKPDGVTPSDVFDRGAGRIQVDLASRSGLVLDEKSAAFQAANPASSGDPSTLNVASLQNSRCFSSGANTCTFTRTFRGTQNRAVTWSASASGLSINASPATFSTTDATTLVTVAFTVDASALTADGELHQGEVRLTANDASLPTLHLPVAVAIQAPAIALSADSVSLSIPNTATTQDATLTVSNIGGPTLQVVDTNLQDAVPEHAYVAVDQTDLSNSGAPSDFFTDFGSGQYIGDDFTVLDPSTNLSLIRVPGFMAAATPLAALTGNAVHFRIYRTASGTPRPDGAPEAPTLPPNNAPVWQFDRNIGQAGLDVAGDTITLDLAAAGASDTQLPPGTYWLVVYPEVSYSALSGGRWAVMLANSGSGTAAQYISPTGGTPNWTSISTQFGTPLDAMAMHLEQRVACGAPWLSVAPTALNLGGKQNASLTLSVDSSNFDGGVTSEVGYLCIRSNDASQATTAVRVTATQN